jgi:hypothetical protein
MGLPTLRLGWRVALVGLAAPPLLLLAQASLGRRQGPRFGNVRELKAWAEARGLFCRSDRQDGRVGSGLAVSARPLTWLEVAGLGTVQRRGYEARWHGILWAINLGPGVRWLPAPPWDGECRAWGGVLVTGDPEFLDRIEAESQCPTAAISAPGRLTVSARKRRRAVALPVCLPGLPAVDWRVMADVTQVLIELRTGATLLAVRNAIGPPAQRYWAGAQVYWRAQHYREPGVVAQPGASPRVRPVQTPNAAAISPGLFRRRRRPSRRTRANPAAGIVAAGRGCRKGAGPSAA